jgi:hypothetical protein
MNTYIISIGRRVVKETASLTANEWNQQRHQYPPPSPSIALSYWYMIPLRRFLLLQGLLGSKS